MIRPPVSTGLTEMTHSILASSRVLGENETSSMLLQNRTYSWWIIIVTCKVIFIWSVDHEECWQSHYIISFLCQTLVELIYLIFIIFSDNFEDESATFMMWSLFLTKTTGVRLKLDVQGQGSGNILDVDRQRGWGVLKIR